jgi:hypothetical protein
MLLLLQLQRSLTISLKLSIIRKRPLSAPDPVRITIIDIQITERRCGAHVKISGPGS